MRILSFKGTQLDLTDALKLYVDKRLEPIGKLVQDFEPVADLRVELEKTTNHHKQGPYYRAEFHMHIPGEVVRAEEKEEDLYAAIDAATDQLRRQLKEYKDRLKDKQQRAERPDKAM